MLNPVPSSGNPNPGRPHDGTTKMDRLAAGIMIAIAALLMNGGLVRDVLAEQAVHPTLAEVLGQVMQKLLPWSFNFTTLIIARKPG